MYIYIFISCSSSSPPHPPPFKSHHVCDLDGVSVSVPVVERLAGLLVVLVAACPYTWW